MTRNTQNLSVEIVRFVDNWQPGWVACEFLDAENNRHTLVDKVPMFTDELLASKSAYPRPGAVRCEVLQRWQDVRGRELARVSTERPDTVESAEGRSQFVVFSTQLSD